MYLFIYHFELISKEKIIMGSINFVLIVQNCETTTINIVLSRATS
jgi:hypothetical protein